MKDKIIHLLKPKEFKVWCRPSKSVGDLNVTNKPSKCSCANCLSNYTGRPFRVSHCPDRKGYTDEADWKHTLPEEL